MELPTLVIVTPALAKANNGNWQTAQRWARFLSQDYRVRVVERWDQGEEALMIALHARRSASSVAAWRALPTRRPLVVVLTGTDLYRDIAVDVAAQQSLAWADRLVVLNERGLLALPEVHRAKASVSLQSTPARQTLSKSTRHLRALMVGHLREEKSPQTYFRAARLLAHRSDILLDHIGAPLDPSLAQEAEALMREQPRYRWLGALPHEATRRRIQSAHVLVHASRMEGGAHVVIEAVTSGTPVLASRIDGNLGLLGENYGGCFDWDDAPALASLLQRCRDDNNLLASLEAQCRLRAALFNPALEKQQLIDLLQPLTSLSTRTLRLRTQQKPRQNPA
jgi:putative glycosyltransferase (TIGR04348 family)